jgi:cyclic pyranopterin phosphate synthase
MSNDQPTLSDGRAPLVDSLGRLHTYLRISVTDRCNLRCAYCMPPGGIMLKAREELLSFEEIERVAVACAAMGVSKVRISGGEPLVRKGVEELVARIGAIEGIEQVTMTTNGVLLAEKIGVLKQAGLRRVNVSLDTLCPGRFEELTGSKDFDRVMGGIFAAMEEVLAPLKLNVVVLGGVNDDELIDFIEFVRDKPVEVRFIEFMPFRGNRWRRGRLVPYSKMLETISESYSLTPIVDASEPLSVAKSYAVEGYTGTVSFISSLTERFCRSCNRIRLTADGGIKTCLFHPPEISLREAMRNGASDESLETMIRRAVGLKRAERDIEDGRGRHANGSMIQIGG